MVLQTQKSIKRNRHVKSNYKIREPPSFWMRFYIMGQFYSKKQSFAIIRSPITGRV